MSAQPKTKLKVAEPASKTRMDVVTIEMMMGGLLRQKEAFEAVDEHLQFEQFTDDERHWWALVMALREYYKRHRVAPSDVVFASEMNQFLQDEQNSLAPEQETALQTALEVFYAVPAEKFDVDWVLEQVRRFIAERLEDSVKADLASTDLLILPEILGDLQLKISAVEQLGSTDAVDLFEDGWGFTPTIRRPTGLGFFDCFTGGGDAGGEVYGLIGPTGGCKTMLMLQLVAETARRFYGEWLADKSQPPKMVYLATYEATVPEIRQRLSIYMAQIPSEDYNTLTKWADLSTSTNLATLKQYEKERFNIELGSGVQVLGERERYMGAMEMVKKIVRVLDYSGSNPNEPAGKGCGLVPELAATMRKEARKQRIGLLAVDYVSAATERHIAHTNVGYNDLRQLVGRFPMHCRNKIAVPLDIPVYVAAQLAAAQTSKAPTYIPHHNDAAEAKNFGENTHFCFNLGTMDTKEHCCVISCSKHRTAPPRTHTIVHVQGSLGRVEHAFDKFVLDTASKGIVRKDLKQRMQRADDTDEEEAPGERPKPAVLNPNL